MKKLPYYYGSANNVRTIMEVVDSQLTQVEGKAQSLANNTAVTTADEIGLPIYEKEYGITPTTEDIETRRSVIMAKIRGVGALTKKKIKDIAESYVNGEVEVSEDAEDFMIIIQFLSQKGIPAAIQELTDSLYESIPAYADIKFEFIYYIWNERDGMVWNDADQMTWDEFTGGI